MTEFEFSKTFQVVKEISYLF